MLRPATRLAALAATAMLLPTCVKVSGAAFNLDAAFEEYARGQAEIHNTRVSWTDCWRNHSHLRETRIYKPYQVELQAGQFWLEDVAEVVRKPSVVYSHKYVNRQSTGITAFAMHTTRREETTRVTVTRGFECNATSSVTATIGHFIALGAGLALSVHISRVKEQSEVIARTTDIDLQVRVPPRSEVTVDWHVTEVKKDIPWNQQVLASGYCAVWYEQQVLGHFLHFVPLPVLAGSVPELEYVDGSTVAYTTGGVMTSVGTEEHNVIVTERLHRNHTSSKTTTCKPKRRHKTHLRRFGRTG